MSDLREAAEAAAARLEGIVYSLAMVRESRALHPKMQPGIQATQTEISGVAATLRSALSAPEPPRCPACDSDEVEGRCGMCEALFKIDTRQISGTATTPEDVSRLVSASERFAYQTTTKNKMAVRLALAPFLAPSQGAPAPRKEGE